jgi:hypothetical protein
MLAYQHQNKGYGRLADCSVALRACITALCKSPDADEGVKKAIQLLYQLRKSHVIPLQKHLQSLRLPERPTSSPEAEKAINGNNTDPNTKGKGKASVDADRRHNFVLAACTPPAVESPTEAVEQLALNMTRSIVSNGAVDTDAFGWPLILRTTLSWRTVHEKSRGRLLKKIAQFAVIEEAFARNYRANVLHSGNVLDLRASLRTFMREVTLDADWDFIDYAITSAPSAPAIPATSKGGQAQRPRRKAATARATTHDSDHDDKVALLSPDAQIRNIIRAVETSPVASIDGKEGSPVDGHVASLLKGLVEVRSSWYVRSVLTSCRVSSSTLSASHSARPLDQCRGSSPTPLELRNSPSPQASATQQQHIQVCHSLLLIEFPAEQLCFQMHPLLSFRILVMQIAPKVQTMPTVVRLPLFA